MSDSYDIEVKLIAITDLCQPLGSPADAQKGKPSEELIEYAGRLCWDATDKQSTNPNRIQDWIKVGHESMIEHASATFFIRGSRALTHELVRHRVASYSQRSQRYVKETEPKYVKPPEFGKGIDGKAADDIYEKAMLDAWDAYAKLLKLGVKAEIARYVLPNACETQIIVTMNFRELRHFIKLRAGKRALPEIRAVAGEIRRIMQEQAPRVFSDL